MHPEIIGDFEPQRSGTLLEIHLHSRPRWRAAQEVAQYVAHFLDVDLQEQCGSLGASRSTAEDLAYAVSELMENAAKYSLPGGVHLQAVVREDSVILTLAHAVAASHAERYRFRAVDMTEQDPTELLLATVERNALQEGESAGSSGLGLLSLLSDYGARLGWIFEPIDDVAVRVTTQARLPLRH